MATVTTRDISQTPKKSPSLKVLVVDDEPLMRWSVTETLTDYGYEVVDSTDLSLLASIRRMAPHAQVILMTAFGTPEVVRGALDLGAFRVVSKPFEMDAVADLVAQACAARITH
jgi:DNA-binding NtrC family response regulator